jgi:hypothetical protein
VGARGGIPTLDAIENLIRGGQRRPAAYDAEQLEAAGKAR